MNWQTFRAILLTLVFMAVAACGSGGGGGGVASGGTGGTGISSGSITGFGSIFVNGVEFSTNGATILKDDVSVTENDMKKGMSTEVRGSITSSTSGTANTVIVEETVRGRVESINPFVVLGQTIFFDETTCFDNNTGQVPGGTNDCPAVNLNNLAVGDLVEVYGLVKSAGIVSATFIEKKNQAVVFVVRGFVSNHNGANTFKIGNLTVDYTSGPATINDMPAGNWNSLFVEVKGTNCSGISPAPCGTLTATKVEPAGLGLANANQAEIEGFVTARVSTADFTVNSQRVRTTGSTVFLGGLQDEIVLGVKLEVEGSLAGGVLTATKVKFKDSVKIESNATANASTITPVGLPGITVTANAFTDFKNVPQGTTASNLTPLDGRNVRIRGRASGPTSVIATEIEDRGASDPNGDVILQGVVAKADVTNPTFKILGVTVDTSQLAAVDFRDVNDNAIVGGQTAFFNALTPNGGLVKAKGRLPAGANALVAGTLREVELED